MLYRFYIMFFIGHINYMIPPPKYVSRMLGNLHQSVLWSVMVWPFLTYLFGGGVGWFQRATFHLPCHYTSILQLGLFSKIWQVLGWWSCTFGACHLDLEGVWALKSKILIGGDAKTVLLHFAWLPKRLMTSMKQCFVVYRGLHRASLTQNREIATL